MTDRQIIIERHYDRKYTHIQTVKLLNMHKNLEICTIEIINYRIRKNIGGSNIWRMVENVQLARF